MGGTVKVLLASHLYPHPAAPLQGTFVAEIAHSLAAMAAVSVVAPITWLPGASVGARVPRSRRDGPVVVHHPRRWFLPPPLRRSRWRAHLAALRSARAEGLEGPWDVIHSHWIDPDAYAVSCWEGRRGAALVATIHGHAAVGFGTRGRPSPVIRRALLRMDHVVVVSEELKTLVVDTFGVAPGRVSVCFNGVDPALFRRQGREEARRRLGLPLNRRVVLNVARLSAEKRQDVLLEAVARCPERDFAVHLVGVGPREAELLGHIRRSGLENRVFLEGGVRHEDLPDWFAAADLFCLSSAHEGCPVVVHEALACGIPVASTRVGAVPDLVGPDCGVLCPPGDARALSGALSTALGRTWDAEAIARQGALHTWDGVGRRLKELYAGLVREERSPLSPERAGGAGVGVAGD